MHPQPENSSSQVNTVCIVNLRYYQPQIYHFISIVIFLKLITKNLLTLDGIAQFRGLFAERDVAGLISGTRPNTMVNKKKVYWLCPANG